MAAFAEDLMFGDFSDLDVEEYWALFRDPLQSSNVEFPWDDKSLAKPVPQDCSGGYIPREQGFNVQNASPSIPLLPHARVLQVAHQAGQGSAGARYTYQSKQAEPPNLNRENFPNQWNNCPDAACTVPVDSQEQSSDGASGNDLQGEEGTRRRRNKKRRDPDHYRKYLEGTSFDNDGRSESTGEEVKDAVYYHGSSEPVIQPPTVPPSQLINSVAIDMPPDPMYDYNAHGQVAERTSVCMQPAVAAISTSESLRTADYCNVEYKASVEPCIGQDADQQFPQTGIVEPVGDGIACEHSATSEKNIPEPIDVDKAASTPAVPTIHISHSDSTTSNEFDEAAEGGPSAVPSGEAEAAEQATAQAPAAAAAAPKVKSWASLFKGNSGSPSGNSANAAVAPIVVTASESANEGDRFGDGAVVTVPTNQDPCAKKLGEHLRKVIPSHHPMNLQPRGLINTANWCYINSILQALLSCPPFYHIMRNLPLNNGVRKASSTPMLDAMYQFLQEFQELKGLSKRSSQDIRPGAPFEPANIYQMLSVSQTSLSVKQGRQEDAEEFLSCLLNGLHDEMTSLIQTAMGEESQPQESSANSPAAAVAVSNGALDSGVSDDGDE